jgi:hypothetical protein
MMFTYDRTGASLGFEVPDQFTEDVWDGGDGDIFNSWTSNIEPGSPSTALTESSLALTPLSLTDLNPLNEESQGPGPAMTIQSIAQTSKISGELTVWASPSVHTPDAIPPTITPTGSYQDETALEIPASSVQITQPWGEGELDSPAANEDLSMIQLSPSPTPPSIQVAIPNPRNSRALAKNKKAKVTTPLLPIQSGQLAQKVAVPETLNKPRSIALFEGLIQELSVLHGNEGRDCVHPESQRLRY